MPTAVLDLSVESIPDSITIEDIYSHVYILFRYKKIPVTALWLPVNEGLVALKDHHDRILRASEGPLVDYWVRKQHEPSAVKFAHPAATVAICTRDRTDDLKRCLNSLKNLNGPHPEILVVDNAPATNATHDLLTDYPWVRYVREDQPGLNNARNRALKEANGEIVAFIDDDAVATEDWLIHLLEPFERERVVCVTGMTQPLELLHEGQEAFERYSPFCKGFRKRVFDAKVNPLSTGHMGAGVNMAIRKSITEKIGWFHEALDAGTPAQSGGDHEYFTRILRYGYYIVYEPAALNWHRHRRTLEDTRKAIYGYGVGMYAYWTKLLLEDKEWWMLRQAWTWFWGYQLPQLVRSFLRKGDHQPFTLVWAEWKGCLQGPSAFLRSRKKIQRTYGRKQKPVGHHSYA